MKNRSHRYDTSRTRFRHGRKLSKHKKFLSVGICIKQYLTNIEAQFTKKLSNTKAGLKKCIAYEKKL